MGLSVAFRHDELLQELKPVKIKQPNARERRVNLWMARQQENDYQQGLKKYAARIKAIQEHFPGWMPKKDI